MYLGQQGVGCTEGSRGWEVQRVEGGGRERGEKGVGGKAGRREMGGEGEKKGGMNKE